MIVPLFPPEGSSWSVPADELGPQATFHVQEVHERKDEIRGYIQYPDKGTEKVMRSYKCDLRTFRAFWDEKGEHIA